MYESHERSYYDLVGDYCTYETSEEAYLIAASDSYGPGLYINEHSPNEYFIKEKMIDGEYSVGFCQHTSSNKSMYIATNDGGMVKDDETWVSINEAEIYLINADSYGYIPFNLYKIQYDWEINVTIWYRIVSKIPLPKPKRGRKRKNVY